MGALDLIKRALPRSLPGRVVLGSTLVYGLLVGLVAALHRTFVFPAPSSGLEPIVPGAELLRLDCEGTDVIALWSPPKPGRSVVVFFHGNAQELVDLTALARQLGDRGVGLMFVEYPGYGVAKGRPSEASLYEAASRALAELPRLGVDREHTVLVGQSLGTGVAVEMAVRGFGSRLLLISPFTSMVDMVQRFAPFAPVALFMNDRFDNLAKAPRVDIETVVVHGDKDGLVPVDMGRDIATSLRGSRLEVFSGGGHNDLFTREDGRLLRLIVGLATSAKSVARGPNPMAN